MKALVGAFNQEKALVGAFSVIVQLHRWIGTQHYSRIPHLKCCKSEIMFTNGLRHSWHHHEVVHAHGGHVIHLVLLEKLLQVSPQQIHKVDKLNVYDYCKFMGLLRGFMAMRSSRDRVVNGTSRNYAMPFVLGECAYLPLTVHYGEKRGVIVTNIVKSLFDTSNLPTITV